MGIKITSQVCDGEKYIQKCFTNAVAQCYQSQVPNCRMVPRQVTVPTCSQSSYCNTCSNYIGGDEETIDVGNTTIIGGNIPGSGGYYPYGQQAGSFLVEDVLPEITN